MSYTIPAGERLRHSDGKKPTIIFWNGAKQPLEFSLREYAHEPDVLHIFVSEVREP